MQQKMRKNSAGKKPALFSLFSMKKRLEKSVYLSFFLDFCVDIVYTVSCDKVRK